MSGVAPNTARAMAAHWDGRADRFQQSPSHRRLQKAWADVFAAAIGQGCGNAVDLGCGTGACALELASLGYRVTAVDGSDRMLAHARDDAAQRGLAIDFVLADMDSLAIEPGRADVVSIRNVLWTLEQPAQAFGMAARLLRPGGKLFVSDGIWREGTNDSEERFGTRLPNFNGVSEQEARDWLAGFGFSNARSWQHLFEAHPYGPKYDAAAGGELIDFFVLTATA